MQLTVRDIAKLLNASERMIYRWIKRDELPAYRIGEQYRFNRAEVLEWATERRLRVSTVLFHEPGNGLAPRLSEALEAGGIFYGVKPVADEAATPQASALRACVDILKLPHGIDRDLLWHILVAQETLRSMAVGDGVALPHVRMPVIFDIPAPVLALIFFENAVDFGKGHTIRVLFLLICPTVGSHLQLLSKLLFALRDERFKAALLHNSPRDVILAEARRVETLFGQSASVGADRK